MYDRLIRYYGVMYACYGCETDPDSIAIVK